MLSDLIEERFGLPTNVGKNYPAEGTLGQILNRRTHRGYTSEVIDEDLLAILLACGLSASAKSDLQQASVIRVQDPKKRQAIADLTPSMPWIADAPVFLVFCGDNLRIRRAAALRGNLFLTTTWICL